MSENKVIVSVTVYEVNGEEKLGDSPQVIVESHWNRKDFVTLKIPGTSKTVTVCGSALTDAIRSATL